MFERFLHVDFSKVPFAKILLFGMLGCVVARFFEPDDAIFVRLDLFLPIGAFFLLVLFLVLRRHHYSFRATWFILGQLWIVGAFYYLSSLHLPIISSNHFSHYKSNWMMGVIRSEPVIKNERVRFVVEVECVGNHQRVQRVQGNLQVNVPFQGDVLKYLDRILLPAHWTLVKPPLNPHELNYQFHLSKNNIWHQLYLSENLAYKIFEKNRYSLIDWSLGIREEMVAKFGQYLSDPVALAIASTLILGYRAELDQEILSVFSITGTIHVLSVSGMHVVLVFLLLDRLLYWVRGNNKIQILRLVLLIAAVWLYALISGLSPSVLRASAMLTFVLIGNGINRKGSVYNSLCVSAFFILLFYPKLIWDLGFQLSYLAVFFIVFCQDLWSKIWSPRHRLFRSVWLYCGMSIAAQMGSGPLAIYYFKQFPVYFLLANLGIVLPSTAIMYLGFLLLLNPLDPLNFWIGQALQMTILGMNTILYEIADLPAAGISFRSIGAWELVLVYCMVFLLIQWARSRSIFWLHHLLFCSLVWTWVNFYETKTRKVKRRVVIHHVGKQIAVSYASRNRVYVYTTLEETDMSTYTFRVEPYIRNIQSGREVVKIKNNQSFFSLDLVTHRNLFWLPDFRLLIWDRSRDIDRIEGRIDVLLLRQNRIAGVEEIMQSKQVDLLVLDASNSQRIIDQIITWGIAYGQKCYVMKDNFAYFGELRDHRSCVR